MLINSSIMALPREYSLIMADCEGLRWCLFRYAQVILIRQGNGYSLDSRSSLE